MTTIDPTSVSYLRACLEVAQADNCWLGGAAIILDDGSLDAVPGAYSTDATYTGDSEVIFTVDLDGIGDLLGMSDDELLAFIEARRADNSDR